jgi:putative ABC transport system permease protein
LRETKTNGRKLKEMLRDLWKNKTVSFINIAGLAIGLAAAILILIWVQNEFSYDNYHPGANRIFFLTWANKNKEIFADGSPLLVAGTAKREIPEIENSSRYLTPGSIIPTAHINGQIYPEKNVVFADSNWFDLFHYDFIEGNASTFDRNSDGIVLTRKLAEKYFGKANAIGQVIRIDSTDYQVKAVVGDNPSNSSFRFDLFLPLTARFANASANEQRAFSSWTSFNAKTFIRIRPDARIEKCAAKIDALLRTNKSIQDANAVLIPLKEMHFGVGLPPAEIQYGNRKVTLIFAFLGVLLLFIGCINYVNLVTARASLRFKEVSIKKIMGASRPALFREFMNESLLTGAIALLLALGIIRLSLPFFNNFSGKHFELSLSNFGIWEVFGIAWIITILLTGIYPAVLLSSFSPIKMLNGENVPRSGSVRLRKALVVFQFSATIALITGTIVIFSQLQFIQRQNEGYNRSLIFSVNIPAPFSKVRAGINEEAFANTVKHELLKQTGIEQVTVVSGSILNLGFSMGGIADWDGKAPGFDPMIYPVAVDAEFRKIFQLQLKEGRWFDPDNIRDKHNYVLNETSVATFGLHRPYLGQRFALLGDTGEVIGIVRDFHFRSFHEKIGSIVFVDDAPWKSTFFVKTAPGSTAKALQASRRIWNKFFPDAPFDYSFLDEAFDQLYRSDIQTSTLIGIFAGIAIVLSCLGLLGLASFTSRQRKKEMAIRKVLGASVRQIAGILSGGFLRGVLVSLVISCPVAWCVMNKWLESFAYRISITWWMFALAGGVAVFIAILTIAFQAIRSAVTSPVESLRNP